MNSVVTKLCIAHLVAAGSTGELISHDLGRGAEDFALATTDQSPLGSWRSLVTVGLFDLTVPAVKVCARGAIVPRRFSSLCRVVSLGSRAR